MNVAETQSDVVVCEDSTTRYTTTVLNSGRLFYDICFWLSQSQSRYATLGLPSQWRGHEGLGEGVELPTIFYCHSWNLHKTDDKSGGRPTPYITTSLYTDGHRSSDVLLAKFSFHNSSLYGATRQLPLMAPPAVQMRRPWLMAV